MTRTGTLIGYRGDGPPDVKPPKDEVGGQLMGPPFVAEGPESAVIVTQVLVFSTGLAVDLEVRFNARDTPGAAFVELKRLMRNEPGRGGGEFRLAIRYPDGTTTHLSAGNRALTAEGPDRPGLLRYAQGTGPVWRLGYWIRSLPAGGESVLSVEWPYQGIALAQFTVSSEAVRLAEARIRRLWESASPV